MQTCTPGPAQDICPTQEQCFEQLLALQPRGRAWENNDGGPFGGVRYGFWNAIASLVAWANQRICDLREEFFCATASETLDVWDEQYGLPDGCDPFPILCVKVAALGGAICEYFQQVCAAAGWTIQCYSGADMCGGRFGGAKFGANVGAVPSTISRFGKSRFGQQLGCGGLIGTSGAPRFGSAQAATLIIIVITRSSPSYSPPASLIPRFGRQKFGMQLGCGTPNIEGLQCLIERITPAHAQIVYEVI